MHIREVKTAKKVADVVLQTNKNINQKIRFNFTIDNKRARTQGGIVYLIVVNNIIYKIGYTRAKSGISSAMVSYQGGLGGSPSLRTFAIHLLIYYELEKDNVVEIYAIFSDVIKGTIKGLFKEHENVSIYPSHEMENLCRKDYFSVEHSYPLWNYKENRKDFPKEIQIEHAKHISVQKAK